MITSQVRIERPAGNRPGCGRKNYSNRITLLPERRGIKKIAKSKPTEHNLPFSTWSLIKLADFLVTEG